MVLGAYGMVAPKGASIMTTTWLNFLLDARTVLECAREHAPSRAERAGLERAITQVDRLLLVATAYQPEEQRPYYEQDSRAS